MTLSGKSRPQQKGRVVGIDQYSGQDHSVAVTWLVDTGAELTTVRDCVGREFSYRRVRGATASTTTGGGGILVVTGLEAEFSVTNALGKVLPVRSSKVMGVKSNNSGSDLLGMIQLADKSAIVDWDPRNGLGSLRVRKRSHTFIAIVVGMLAVLVGGGMIGGSLSGLLRLSGSRTAVPTVLGVVILLCGLIVVCVRGPALAKSFMKGLGLPRIKARVIRLDDATIAPRKDEGGDLARHLCDGSSCGGEGFQQPLGGRGVFPAAVSNASPKRLQHKRIHFSIASRSTLNSTPPRG